VLGKRRVASDIHTHATLYSRNIAFPLTRGPQSVTGLHFGEPLVGGSSAKSDYSSWPLPKAGKITCRPHPVGDVNASGGSPPLGEIENFLQSGTSCKVGLGRGLAANRRNETLVVARIPHRRAVHRLPFAV